MARLNPYLDFNGNTREAFDFYKSVFGGEYSALTLYKDIPGADKMSDEDKEKIMHIALPISNESVLMASDTLSSPNQKFTIGDNFRIAVHVDSHAEGERLFNALAEGGEIEMPFEKIFWGDTLGILKDKFNIHWIVNYRPI